MSNRKRNTIQCEIFKNPNQAWLEEAWCDLEQRSTGNFFLSWLWIGTWIDNFVNEFYVIEARLNNKIVGLGVLVKQPTKYPLSAIKTKYYLHRTGRQDLDQVWIEYNDFLVDAENEESIRVAMAKRLVNELDRLDAIVIGASDEDRFSCINEFGLKSRKIWETANYALDLDELRDKKISVLESLSRNTRSQILRSIRSYEKIGAISINKACSIDAAKEMLLQAKPLHLARWKNAGIKSGFTNEKFVAFHEKIIERGVENKVVELNHIKVGNETISIIYNFNYKGKIYFYLCGINYCYKSSHFKPGLVSHYLLINKALEEGLETYDFMAGEARYKASFSNRKGTLSVSQYEVPSKRLEFEGKLREFKQQFIS
ncbi:GNAT family N-acetyltransferase [Photobacterium sanctipauli]|uniref:GNAT family N-acetyltransferase n=2 Tax=Photobacterium sanctipauli TaxID=1342794 RepID=UPI001304F1BF|nr:GNAT family N-acetyltransferase [Photobacterium sanctipauli]